MTLRVGTGVNATTHSANTGDINFSLTHNGRARLQVKPQPLAARVAAVLGEDFGAGALEVEESGGQIGRAHV